MSTWMLLGGAVGLRDSSAAGKIYWTDSGTDKIQRADLGGTNVEDLVTGLEGPLGIALDLSARKIYWTDIGTRKIQRANLDGSDVEDIVTMGAGNTRAIALDTAFGKMYWVDNSTGKIRRANLDGSNVEELITMGLQDMRAIALDLFAGKMYWTNSFASAVSTIHRADLDGMNVEDVVAVHQATALSLDLAAGKMYWTDQGSDKIQRANLDGSNVEDLVTAGLIVPAGIALQLELPDFDEDGIADISDNCRDTFNPGQVDVDLDRIGDACDPFPDDPDNEQAQCEADFDQTLADLNQCEGDLAAAIADPRDADGDGEGDSTDACPVTPSSVEVDGDGCSQLQFCSSIDVSTSGGRARCTSSDWTNDEPLGRPATVR